MRRIRRVDPPVQASAPPLRCILCGRSVPESQLDWHHLVPRLKGGRETAPMHRICHRQVHALFSEAQLARHYASPETLLGHRGTGLRHLGGDQARRLLPVGSQASRESERLHCHPCLLRRRMPGLLPRDRVVSQPPSAEPDRVDRRQRLGMRPGRGPLPGGCTAGVPRPLRGRPPGARRARLRPARQRFPGLRPVGRLVACPACIMRSTSLTVSFCSCADPGADRAGPSGSSSDSHTSVISIADGRGSDADLRPALPARPLPRLGRPPDGDRRRPADPTTAPARSRAGYAVNRGSSEFLGPGRPATRRATLEITIGGALSDTPGFRKADDVFQLKTLLRPAGGQPGGASA
jgi:hypothetical protein